VSEPQQAAPAADVIQEWRFQGLTLPATGETGPRVKGGTVSLDELELFVARVRAELPGAVVVVHEYGLRAIWSATHPEHHSGGPKMDWSDWT
jgi:hypothetical protein